MNGGRRIPAERTPTARPGVAATPKAVAHPLLALQCSAGNAALARSTTVQRAPDRMVVVNDDLPAPDPGPDVPAPGPLAPVPADDAQAKARHEIDDFVAKNSTVVATPSGAGFPLVSPVLALWNKLEQGILAARGFASNLATTGAKAAVDFARTTILGVTGATGPVGWLVGGALALVDHLANLSQRATDFVVSKVMGIVDPIIERARMFTVFALYQGQKEIQEAAEPTAVSVLSSIESFWAKIKAGLKANPVYQWLKGSISTITSIWATVKARIPGPIAKVLPDPPVIPWPDDLDV